MNEREPHNPYPLIPVSGFAVVYADGHLYYRRLQWLYDDGESLDVYLGNDGGEELERSYWLRLLKRRHGRIDRYFSRITGVGRQ